MDCKTDTFQCKSQKRQEWSLFNRHYITNITLKNTAMYIFAAQHCDFKYPQCEATFGQHLNLPAPLQPALWWIYVGQQGSVVEQRESPQGLDCPDQKTQASHMSQQEVHTSLTSLQTLALWEEGNHNHLHVGRALSKTEPDVWFLFDFFCCKSFWVLSHRAWKNSAEMRGQQQVKVRLGIHLYNFIKLQHWF